MDAIAMVNRISINVESHFAKTQYKMICKTKQIQHIIYFKHNESVVIIPGLHQIYLKNPAFFGHKFILFDTINVGVHGSTFTDTLCIDENNNITSAEYDEKFYSEIGRYKFALDIKKENKNDDDIIKAKSNEYTFQNELSIPITSGNMEFFHDLYAKPVDNSFDWIKIKSLLGSKYTFKQNKSLYINTVLNINEFDPVYGRNGVIQILCDSDIIITEAGMINANECGMNKDISLFCRNVQDTADLQLLEHGRFVGNTINKSDYGFGGGIIELVSFGKIINNGNITSVGTNNNFSCGIISIVAKGNFINSGKINGNVLIKCKKFINNNGFISNEKIENNIILTADMTLPVVSKISAPWNIMNNINHTDEKQIELTVRSHRGHRNTDDSFHPKHLLDVNDDEYYMSEYGVTSSGWIMLEMKTDCAIKPTKIRIKNGADDSAIRCISIFIGSSNTFFPLCSNITNIQMSSHWDNLEIQEWSIGDKCFLTDYYLPTNKLNLIKIKVLRNHGYLIGNAFCSFELFGVECGVYEL
eukprot:409588_1